MIDWERTRELCEEIGWEDYAEVIGLFFEEVDEAISRLRLPATMAEREADMHFLKGCSLNLGFTALGELCSDGEISAASGSLTEQQVTGVIEAYEASRRIFDAGRAAA